MYIPRETLQQNKIFRVIKKTLVKKCLEMTRGSFVQGGAGTALSANGSKREQHTQGAKQAAQKKEKDVTGWTEVTRKKKKMVQMFVKVDGAKTSAMEMKMSDIMKKIPISGQDVYVTSAGRVLRGGEELKRSGVRDGSTVHVMSRLRGGGRHKDKKNKVEKKQVAILRRTSGFKWRLTWGLVAHTLRP